MLQKVLTLLGYPAKWFWQSLIPRPTLFFFFLFGLHWQ